MRAVRDVEGLSKELIGRGRSTVRARARRIGVRDVSPGLSDERVEVLTTCLAIGRDKGDIFSRRASDGITPNSLTEKTTDEVGVGREPVHPLPPA